MENKDEFVSPRLKIQFDPHLNAWYHRSEVMVGLHPFFWDYYEIYFIRECESRNGQSYICTDIWSLPTRTLE